MTTNVGGYLLRDLKDPTLPEAISWLPQTIGWKILALFTVLLIVRILYKKVVGYWRNRYRIEAKEALNQVNKFDASIAINQYQQITKIVINYAQSQLPYQKNLNKGLIDLMLISSTKPLNEVLLKDWYQALMQPKLAHGWNIEKLTELQGEIETWLTFHEFSGVNS